MLENLFPTFFYFSIQECYVFFEFCNMFAIFVVEDRSFFGNEDDIHANRTQTRE